MINTQNSLLLKSILEIDASEKPVQLMAHLLASQQIWAQTGQHLKLAELKQLPVTDYIFYLRSKGL